MNILEKITLFLNEKEQLSLLDKDSSAKNVYNIRLTRNYKKWHDRNGIYNNLVEHSVCICLLISLLLVVATYHIFFIMFGEISFYITTGIILFILPVCFIIEEIDSFHKNFSHIESDFLSIQQKKYIAQKIKVEEISQRINKRL